LRRRRLGSVRNRPSVCSRRPGDGVIGAYDAAYGYAGRDRKRFSGKTYTEIAAKSSWPAAAGPDFAAQMPQRDSNPRYRLGKGHDLGR
jgi:hypothetical protein